MKFTNLVWMIADQNFCDICFTFFYPTASATVYGPRPKFFRAEHSATAEGENCTYGPTLLRSNHWMLLLIICFGQIESLFLTKMIKNTFSLPQTYYHDILLQNQKSSKVGRYWSYLFIFWSLCYLNPMALQCFALLHRY